MTTSEIPDPAIWTIEDAAGACKVSFMTIHRAVKSGHLTFHLRGPRKLRFVPADVVRWVSERAARKAARAGGAS
jgi:excisionase family DNA binding protein